MVRGTGYRVQGTGYRGLGAGDTWYGVRGTCYGVTGLYGVLHGYWVLDGARCSGYGVGQRDGDGQALFPKKTLNEPLYEVKAN